MPNIPTVKGRFAFDGVKEIDAALRSFGRAGKEAIDNLRKAADSSRGPLKNLNDSVVRLRRDAVALRAAAGRAGASFRTLGRRGGELRNALARVGRRFALLTGAATAAALALGAVSRAGAQAADQAAKNAEGLGLSVEQYSALQFAAEQSGITVEQFATGLNALNSRIAEAVKGQKDLGTELGRKPEEWAAALEASVRGGEALADSAEGGNRATAALRRLGIQLTDSRGNVRPTRDLLVDLAEAFRKFPDGVEEAGLAAALFGEEMGRRFLPLLNQGRAGVEALEAEAQRLGVGFTTAQARIGTALIDAGNRLRRAVAGVRNQIGLLFAPALTETADRFTESLVRNRRAILDFVEGVVPQAVRVFEDLIALLQGRDADVRTVFLLEARDAVVGFATEVRDAWLNLIKPSLEGLLALFDGIAANANRVFGTDLTGRQIAIAAAVAQVTGAVSALGSALLVVAAAAAAIGRSFGVVIRLAPVAASLFRVLVASATLFGATVAGLVGWPALLVAGVAAAGVAIVVFWDEIKAGAIAAFDFIVEAAPKLWSALVAIFRAGRARLHEVLRDGLSALSDLFGSAFDAIGNLAAGLADRIVGFLSRALERVRAIVNTIRSLITGAGSAASDLGGPRDATGGGGGSGFFRGGRVVGPGTETSDSVPIRASVGEFVVQAKAVRKYGARLFAALNAMSVPAPARPLPGFNLGGMVTGIAERLGPAFAPPRLPAYAHGGPVAAPAAQAAGGRAVVIQLGGRSFPTLADDEVAEALLRVLRREERASGGKIVVRS